MKSMGSGVILKSKAVTPIECLHYSLNLPSVVITGIDSMNILKQAFKAAAGILSTPLAAGRQAESQVGDPCINGREFELFETTSVFDSTAKHPEWLGEESGRTQRLAGE